MFSTKGHFKAITCPLGDECDLLNCFFKHDEQKQAAHDASQASLSIVDDQPQLKRARLSTEANTEPPSNVVKPVPAFTGTLVTTKPPSKPGVPTSNSTAAKPAAYSGHLSSADRSISPPPLRKPQQSLSASTAKKDDELPVKHTTEQLNPRMLQQAPAPHQKRLQFLKKLHEGMQSLNEKAKKDSEMRSYVLAPKQLVQMALDEEQKAAAEHFSNYGNFLRLRMVAYQKMTVEAWKLHLLEVCEVKTSSNSAQPQLIVHAERAIETGLSSNEECQVLPHLCCRLDGLEKYGYVTSAPSGDEVAQAKQADESEMGYEKCARCHTRFQVFPDRRPEDGALVSGGQCTHHPGRMLAGGKGRPTVYNCCNEALGVSIGCETGNCHVFKTDSPSRLASLLQYQDTPDNHAVDANRAVAVDCEMGYTTYGFELLRVTVLSWPQAERILDILVRPYGAVLDSNTRWSGVSVEQFQEAKPYDPSKGSDVLQMVSSPAEARALLFKHINPSTPIVGHGLDNDLNALRIIHQRIVDTALLCPHSRGLPYRRALRQLARDYLHRTIQAAGIAGHDSAEDAKAAGDVVRLLVGRKWNKMLEQGWKAEHGELVRPKMSPPKSHEVATQIAEAENQHEAQKYDAAVELEEHRALEAAHGQKRMRNEIELDY